MFSAMVLSIAAGTFLGILAAVAAIFGLIYFLVVKK